MIIFDFFEEQQDIFRYFGYEAQKIKLEEEFTEFLQAWENDDLDEIREELADLHNILMQFIDYYGTKEIYKIAVEKIERTKKRIKEGYYDDRK